MLFTSGQEKFIMTPETSVMAAACRGSPLARSIPTSVVVPPMSHTNKARFSFSANSCFTRNAAPHMELVGPLENVRIGTLAARCACRIVPSF